MEKKGNVLIVDDENVICGVLQEALEMEDYCVQSTTNSIDALKYVEDFNYDVIVTDMCMPKISGIDLLNAVNAKNLNTQVVIVTGYNNLIDPNIIDFLEPFAFVTKPFDLEEFVTIVNDAFQKKIELDKSG